MAAFEFAVGKVFDLEERAGLAVHGTTLRGEARPGDTLRDVATGHAFALRGIDLLCSRDPERSTYALIVDRTARDYAQPGRRWVSGDD